MTSDDPTSMSQAFQVVGAGDMQELFPIVYGELKRIAVEKLTHERVDHTLQPTALVHEAYLRLQGNPTDSWKNRAHFFGAAAEAMRRILIEHARGRQRLKRGGRDHERIDFTFLDEIGVGQAKELVALDDALIALAEVEPAKAELVKLKFFTGLTTHEAGEILGLCSRTAERHWAFARAWLYRQMSDNDAP